ncbi:MAG: hypothetical protein GTO22_20875 [Gemmatimonadales bacterium]|nr:hypothetical protein [Gemmatimonadales bacterium]
MMKRTLALTLTLAVAVGVTTAAAQVKTKVRVRVVSHDAKIIGTGVGGARVKVVDPATGKVLAAGIQKGGTGSTRSIVIEPVERGAPIFDTDGAAAVTFELELGEPTVLEFIGEGPLGHEHAIQRASKSLLVLPGEHVLGNGVVLELHGFIVELLEPTAIAAAAGTADVRVHVRMMCGCPLEPAGLWDADRLQVTVRIYADGRMVREARLAYAGEPNIFTGRISLGGLSGGERLVAVASDPTRANFGRSQELWIKR